MMPVGAMASATIPKGNGMTKRGETQKNNAIVSDRRQFLKASALAAVTTALAPVRQALGVLHDAPADRKTLSLYNAHTDEHAFAIYWQNGRYNPKGWYHVNYILRDFRANEIIRIDHRLMDLLHGITSAVGTDDPVHVISGYRSPQTNAILRNTRKGIAKGSLHMSGKAVDIRMPNVPTADLRQLAIALKAGGVGYYPDSGFIHVDVGPVRFW